MTEREFLELMGYPPEWLEWDMYPDDLFSEQVSSYEPGHEKGAEHDRNGVFHWWLRRSPTPEQIRKLIKLSYLDPDIHMAQDARSHIRKAANYVCHMETDLM